MGYPSPSRGVFNLTNWEWVYEGDPFPEDPSELWVSALQDAVFSPDETMIAMFNGVFSTDIWKRVFETDSGTETVFSSDGNYLYVADDAIYDVSSGDVLFEINGYGLFSSNAEVFINVDTDNQTIQAYNLIDESLRWSTNSDKELYYHQYAISSDDTVLLIPNNAIYDIVTGEKLYDMPAYSRFSQDGSLILSNDGLVDAKTGQVMWDASVVAISDGNQYLAVQEQDQCMIYSIVQD